MIYQNILRWHCYPEEGESILANLKSCERIGRFQCLEEIPGGARFRTFIKPLDNFFADIYQDYPAIRFSHEYASSRMHDYCRAIFLDGDVIDYHIPDTQRCSPEEVSAAPRELLKIALLNGDMKLPKLMAQKGANGDGTIRAFIQCRGKNEDWKLEELLDLGMKVSQGNFDTLAACVEYQCPEAGKILMDHGVDFGSFAFKVKGQDSVTGSDTYKELAEYWQEQHQQEPGQEQTM